MGYVSFKKRDVLKPIGIDCHKLIRIFLPFCLGLDAILSVHPYDTQGIPVYSSYWRDKTTELHNSILNRFKIPLQTEYMDVKIVTCEEMAECENVPGYREEVTMAPLVHTETAPPVTETPKMSTECPKDLFKHTDVFVPKKTSFVQLYKGKSYRFYCGQTVNENQKSKVFWRLGASRNSAPHCSSSSPFFQE
uniref:Uncharacterized protein n=1 Tax=Romanomermis culicivorax TaxID=13658 RepID=A0A915KX48_ROMCU